MHAFVITSMCLSAFSLLTFFIRCAMKPESITPGDALGQALQIGWLAWGGYLLAVA